MKLPPFPVDDATLDLLDKAINPGPDAERSSLWDLCELYSQLGGSDTTAVESVVGDVQTMRDPAYSHMDIIDALIREVRRLRALAATPSDSESAERGRDEPRCPRCEGHGMGCDHGGGGMGGGEGSNR